MTSYTYTDLDGDELVVETVDYDGTPHASIGALSPTGHIAGTVHVHPDDVWDLCEAILDAAGLGDEEGDA